VRALRWSWRRSAPAGPFGSQPLGAFGAAGDGGHPPLRGQPALGVQLDHGAVAERLDLLGPPQPHPLVGLGATAGRKLARIEGCEHWVQRRRRRRASAAGGGDGALADGFGVAGRHAEAVAAERLAQGRPGGAQRLSGGVDAAELLGQGEGALGLGPVGQEAAGLPAQPALGHAKVPLGCGSMTGPLAHHDRR
jgi:hypothetical protein